MQVRICISYSVKRCSRSPTAAGTGPENSLLDRSLTEQRKMLEKLDNCSQYNTPHKLYRNLQCIQIDNMPQLNRYDSFEIIWREVPVAKQNSQVFMEVQIWTSTKSPSNSAFQLTEMSDFLGSGNSEELTHLSDSHRHYYKKNRKENHHITVRVGYHTIGCFRNKVSYNWFNAVQELMLWGIGPSRLLLARFLRISCQTTKRNSRVQKDKNFNNKKK